MTTRTDAAAKAAYEHAYSSLEGQWEWAAPPVRADYLAEQTAALAASDAHLLSDATVERAARAVPHDEQCGNSHLEDCGCKGKRVETARAVLAAAVKEDGE